ncbi:helix-turn-helix transcriptional regulator [Citricoccus sp. NR2]|uniref:helix-turn-helix transcriptional regulator n=1 Tax=Citricoccus sp. NR2 TaxID=3004095 RepID=UPI0022DDC33B|nr:helix-turn-helix domain-containing protein [Citricoccus sp. NR2]WBL19199.1 helix-turn-helix domain-containing protein [Citricoccus sp. NR2]
MSPEVTGNLLKPDVVAGYLGTTTANLSQWRYKGTGPKFIKLGHRAIRYRMEDVNAWIEANTLTQSDIDYKPKASA